MNTQNVLDSTPRVASALTGGAVLSLQTHNPDICATASRVEALRLTATTTVEVMHPLRVQSSMQHLAATSEALLISGAVYVLTVTLLP